MTGGLHYGASLPLMTSELETRIDRGWAALIGTAEMVPEALDDPMGAYGDAKKNITQIKSTANVIKGLAGLESGWGVDLTGSLSPEQRQQIMLRLGVNF